jgi:hypothetical protein
VVVVFAALYFAALAALVLRGARISIEERHLRSVGTAMLVLAIVVAIDTPLGRLKQGALFALLAIACAYGLRSHANQAWTMWHSGNIDRSSRTVQPSLTPDALSYLQREAARRGPATIFVLPSPEIAVALPRGARTLGTIIDWEPPELFERRRYEGRSEKGIVVLVPTKLADAAKGRSLRRMFAGYAESEWVRHDFGDSTVFTTDCATRCADERLAATHGAAR